MSVDEVNQNGCYKHARLSDVLNEQISNDLNELTQEDVDPDLNGQSFIDTITNIERFPLKQNYQKKITTIYHELKLPNSELTIHRLYKLNNAETEFFLIDLNQNLFLIYKIIDNEIKVIEIDDSLRLVSVFLATYYSSSTSTLYLCDYESNFYEFSFVDKARLSFKQNFKLKNCGVIEFMELDETVEEKTVYACDIKSDCLHIFNVPSVAINNFIVNHMAIQPKQVRHNEIRKPKYLKIKDDFLFVICNGYENSEKNEKKNMSYVLIIDKIETSVVRKIDLENWFNPYGLYISNKMECLLTTTSKINANCSNSIYSASNSEYLLVIDIESMRNGECKIVSEINLEFDLINDFYIMKDNKILFLLNHVDKPLVIVELN
jgi:hypothetical protein